jgi:hypothetical protein
MDELPGDVTYSEGCKLTAGSAVSDPNIKPLEWMIEHAGIKTLTKLQKKFSSDCQHLFEKTGEAGKG